MESANDRLAALAGRQHGLFSRAQAIEIGLRDRTLRTRTGNGIYQSVLPGVYAFAGADTWHRRVMAAVLSAPSPAAASHMTAARLWRLVSGDEGADVEIVCKRYHRVHRSFVVHESKDLLAQD